MSNEYKQQKIDWVDDHQEDYICDFMEDLHPQEYAEAMYDYVERNTDSPAFYLKVLEGNGKLSDKFEAWMEERFQAQCAGPDGMDREDD